MKAWIGPVMAAAQTAHERREDALRSPATPIQPGTEETTAGMDAAASPSGSDVKVAPEASGSGPVRWWRRWWG
jgi:hypothetical protein